METPLVGVQNVEVPVAVAVPVSDASCIVMYCLLSDNYREIIIQVLLLTIFEIVATKVEVDVEAVHGPPAVVTQSNGWRNNIYLYIHTEYKTMYSYLYYEGNRWLRLKVSILYSGTSTYILGVLSRIPSENAI
jgi:hypothetical protein